MASALQMLAIPLIVAVVVIKTAQDSGRCNMEDQPNPKSYLIRELLAAASIVSNFQRSSK